MRNLGWADQIERSKGKQSTEQKNRMECEIKIELNGHEKKIKTGIKRIDKTRSDRIEYDLINSTITRFYILIM